MSSSVSFPVSRPRRARPGRRPSETGMALVVVLAFVVLLTGLIVAFFSTALSERKASNSSASQTKVELFAQGAVNSIVGDLKQEIAAGSTNVSVTGGTIYLPKAPANAVPALVGSSGANGLQNLVKRSANGLAFSPDGPASRAAPTSTTTTSLNGRYISPARWNKALLLPVMGANDRTPKLTGEQFAPPDWILVGRDGSNPTTVTTNPSDANYVLGRYAYAIYDEGGLLDANVAGYPSTSAADQSAYKPALAYADLTQIGLTPLQSDQLVGWRNWATTKATGNLTGNYSFPPTAGDDYFKATVSNANGFLTINPEVNDNQTDRMFTSRQQLLGFLQNGLGLPATSPAFQCLTHFSRDINQPSLVPARTYDPSAPQILPWTSTASSGGNDASGGDSPSLVTASGDGRINPTFPAVRAKTAFTRNDGSTATVGEPLVKRRFNLNRLAWLTYQGPSQSRSLSDPDMAAQIANGITEEWFQQGTDANILKYFGLTWVSGSNYWTYSHGTPIKTLAQVAALTGANAREPNFFELLKASINAGAIAKSAVTGTAGGPPFNHASNYAADASVDYAILKIGANIIDQFDADGYPTTIHWVNSGNTQDFVGVENLPYLNRVRAMIIKAREANPAVYMAPWGPSVYYNDGTGAYNDGTGRTGPFKLVDTGIGVWLWYPEIWNPHDWNAANLAQTLGTPAPTNFRIFGITDPNGQPTTSFKLYGSVGGSRYSYDASAADSPGFAPGFSFDSNWRQLTAANTEMTFNISMDATGAALFREPTLLLRPGKPTGSNLTAPGLASLTGSIPALAALTGAGGGIKRANSNPALLDAVLADPLTQDYIGFYVGAFPLRWVVNLTSAQSSVYNPVMGAVPPPPNTSANYIFSVENARWFPFSMGFRCVMQYQNASGTWVAYDDKYGDTPDRNGSIMASANTGFFNQSAGGSISYVAPFEPRTSRFGTIFAAASSHGTGYPPFGSGFAGGSAVHGWINQSEGVIWPNRMGKSSGAGADVAAGWMFPSSIGWYPGQATWGNNKTPRRPGLFEQNNPLCFDDGLSFDGDLAPNSQPWGGALSGANYYADADGVVRRAAGAWVPTGTPSTSSSTPAAATSTVGLPQAVANSSSGTSLTRTSQSSSRPMILNRPFRSVADLGYVFSGTPFKNLDFFTPESGYAGLLDVFCLNDTADANSLVAGKVSLNTRQAPVLQAILAGAYKDEFNAAGTTIPGGTGSLAANIANALVARTQSSATGKGPLRNMSELVGRWVQGKTPDGTANTASAPYGPASYDGFSADLQTVLTSGTDTNIQRYRESAMRALSNAGQTRVWNLLIDVVAQVGRYPKSATDLDNFQVDGEQRYWVHVAIDRLTGQVIDKQIEVVKE